jgi:four helix bundle protein
MTQDEMKRRTKQYGLRVMRLVESLPNRKIANHIGGQLLRCGTSVGANYRSACRAKSKADFIAKLAIVEEEGDESIYWMELLIEGSIVKAELLTDLMNEADQIVAIIVASINTVKKSAYPRSQIRTPKSI